MPYFSLHKLNGLAKKSFDASRVRFWELSLYGMFQFTLPYILWGNFEHNAIMMTLRVVGVLLCLLLLFKDDLPKQLTTYAHLYGAFALGYCLCFATIYTLLASHLSAVWVVNAALGTVLLMGLLNRKGFFSVFVLFGTCGVLFYLSIYGLHGMKLREVVFFLYALSMALLIGRVVSKEKSAPEVSQSAQTVCDHMAHAVRTPLATLTLSLQSIERLTPSFLEGYLLAKKANLPVHPISDHEMAHFREVFGRMHLVLRRAFVLIDRIVMNLKTHFGHFSHERLSIKECVQMALEDYPMNDQERDLVVYDDVKDFFFVGNKTLMTNILFNLFKNSFFQIKSVNKGKIFIWVTGHGNWNELHVKDTASGISDNVKPFLFDRHHIKDKSGLGLGLSFCQKAMTVMKGSIRCESVQGDFAEFILHFPQEKQVNDTKQPNKRSVPS